MHFRSRRTLVTAALAAGAITVVAGGATALAQSGSDSPGATPRGEGTVVAALGPLALAARVGSNGDCEGLPDKAGAPAEAAASYLGVTPDELKSEVAAGKSLADIAAAHGKSVDGLKQAMLDAVKADLDRQVASGDLTSDQEQAIMSKLRVGIDDFVDGKGGLSVRVVAKGGEPGPIGKGPFVTAADYLGLSVDQLIEQLRTGKSLAEVASAQGKSVSGLKQKLVDAMTADIEQAVTKLVNQKGLPEPRCVEKVESISPSDGP
jgi:hypothetical protein